MVYNQNIFGKLPKKWKVVKLSTLILKSINGDWGKENEEIGYQKTKIIRGTDFPSVLEGDYSKLPERYIKKGKLQKILLGRGDIIIEISGGSKDQPTGRIVLINNYNDGLPLSYTNFVKKIFLDEEIEKSFFFYLWNFLYNQNLTSVFENRTTNIRNFKFNDFINSLEVPLPPLPEQKAIAKILSTVDEAIQKVNEIIAKTERLKKGLMQELLTKGIGHKEFKDTEIGRIPKEWEVVEFQSICEKLQSGGTPLTSKKEYYGGNTPFVKIEDITNAGKYIFDTKTKITELGLKNSNAWLIPENSLLLAIYGSLGSVAINKVKLATNQAILGIILDKSKADTEFFYYFFLNSKLERYAKQTTQANLTAEIIKKLKIPLPPLTEQQKIAEILSTVDKKFELERKRKEKLERIKKGLMNDLLTGRKRVRI